MYLLFGQGKPMVPEKTNKYLHTDLMNGSKILVQDLSVMSLLKFYTVTVMQGELR